MSRNKQLNKKGELNPSYYLLFIVIVIGLLAIAMIAISSNHRMEIIKQTCYEKGMEYISVSYNDMFELEINKVYCKDYKGNQEIRGYKWKNNN